MELFCKIYEKRKKTGPYLVTSHYQRAGKNIFFSIPPAQKKNASRNFDLIGGS